MQKCVGFFIYLLHFSKTGITLAVNLKHMDAKELRIGNWVIIGDNFPEQVSVETFVILYNYPERETWLKPIPLTPEILEKAGFKPLVKDWQKKGLIIHTRKRGFVVNKRIPVLKSLHQLQNLYFALTGEELPIEL